MKRTLEFTVFIQRPVADVYDHLAHPQNFLGLQPLLIEMSPVQESRVHDRVVRAYETVEAFRLFGRIVYRNRIRVQTTLTDPPVRLDTQVHSPGGVTLDVEYHLAAQGAGTHLTEIMHLAMSRVVAGFVVSQATQAQRAVLARLKARLESA